MKYALNLSKDNRILSICEILENGNYDGMPIVEVFPEGNTYEYIYVNNEYIHDPLPYEEEIINLPLQEERIVALEETNNMLLECILEMSEVVYA